MPCKCSGVRYDKCKCRVLGSSYQLPATGSRVTILANESACCVRAVKKRRSLFIRLFECVYERCAGYNLRYCPIRGFRTKNCGGEALRDVMLLLCFLMANFVVFLTIFARMTLHLAAVMLQSAGWLRRSIQMKMMGQKESLAMSRISAQQSHDFSPPQSHDFTPPHNRF